MSKNGSKRNSLKLQDFSQNYQKVYNNYSSLIKFYTNNAQIIDDIEKIINNYKESIISFKKKLVQLKINLIKPFYNEEKKLYKYEEEIYSYNNHFILVLNQIFNFQIDLLNNFINEIEKNVFLDVEKKRINDYLNSLQQNKNNIQIEQKKMEKLFNEYNSEYKKFYNNFNLIEENVQKYFVNRRKKKSQDEDEDKINKLTNTANFTQNNFLQVHNKFQENNKKYFDIYRGKIEEFEEETIKNETYVKKVINSFLQALINSFKSFLNFIDDYNKENNLLLKEENDINEINDNLIIGEEQSKKKEKIKSKNFMTFQEKNFSPLESKYIKEKYKVRAIHCHILGDEQSFEDKQIMNNLFDGIGLEEYSDNITVVLTDEDVFETIKFFYGKYNFVDTSDYNFILERKKLEVKKLTYKLLQPGLIKKDYDEYKDITPINDQEITKLESFIKKGIEFRTFFLLNINFYRTFGIFDMPEREFEILGNFFWDITDIILNKKNEDFPIFKLIIILSQTFYVNRGEEKYYLFNKLKGHKLFTQIDYIKKYLKFSLDEEFQKSGLKSDRKIKNKDKQDLVFAIILSFCKCMREFGMTKQVLLEINESIYKEYELSEEIKNYINSILETG